MNSKKILGAIRAFSQLTTRHYLAWLAASLFCFIPATVLVLVTFGLKRWFWDGAFAAANYMREKDFVLDFSYANYLAVKARHDKAINP